MGTNINLGYRAIHSRSGFTLIELSIVLVVIGLVIGSILVGQDLIAAAGVRAQIAQIEKYNSAVNTFRGKYNGQLPGDIDNAMASMFGFTAHPAPSNCSSQGCAGQGDGNGLLEGLDSSYTEHFGGNIGVGETVGFWVDLSTANLIDGSFKQASFTVWTGGTIDQYFPAARIGRGNYIYVYSGGWQLPGVTQNTTGDGKNYFALSANITMNNVNYLISAPGLTVAEANNIDRKVDDGLPQSGHVMAMYVDWYRYGASTAVEWAAGVSGYEQGPGGASAAYAGSGGPTTSATSSSLLTCYDNSVTTPNSSGVAAGVSGATQHYSMEVQSGTNINCALSFQFQ